MDQRPNMYETVRMIVTIRTITYYLDGGRPEMSMRTQKHPWTWLVVTPSRRWVNAKMMDLVNAIYLAAVQYIHVCRLSL